MFKSGKSKNKNKDKKGKTSSPAPPSTPPPGSSAPLARQNSSTADGKWGKGTTRPDDSVLAMLKMQCEKEMDGETPPERRFIQLSGPSDPAPPLNPPPCSDSATRRGSGDMSKSSPNRRSSVRTSMSNVSPQQSSDDVSADIDESELKFTGEMVQGRPVVKGGTVEKLIIRLAFEEYPDPDYLKAFMLTYRSFTTPIDLLKVLSTKRWFLEVPDGQEQEQFETKVQRPVRLRVFNVLKHWIQHGFYDFEEDEQLQKELLDFIENTMKKTGMENPANQLIKMYNRQLASCGSEQNRQIVWGSQKPPVPHLPMNLNSAKISLVDLHAEELARQLTLIEYDLYRKIKPKECLNQKWVKGDKDVNAPNILAMIKRFNQVSTWVASEVVKGESVKERTNTLKHVIEVAEYCKSLNNFNAMMEIISGLNNSAVFRLKQTWGALPSKYQKSFEEMASIMSREQNFKNFRAYLHNVDPPCIPYLGVYLTDLTFIEDGNPDNLPDGLVNFVKRQKVSQVIAEIQQYQNTPYCLEEVVFIKEWLYKCRGLSEDECYKLSKQREGRDQGQGGDSTPTPPTQAPPTDDWGPVESIEGYPFDEPDVESKIVLVKDGSVNNIKGATLPKLVERLAHEKYHDMSYMMAFLMTYKSFAKPMELMGLLEKRFNLPRPVKATEAQMQMFQRKRVMPIHLRVFNVLKFWVDKFSVDFEEDTELANRVKSFATSCISQNKMLEKLGSQINTLVDKAQAAPKVTPTHIVLGDSPTVEKAKAVEFDAEQLSNQLAIMNRATFIQIKARECMGDFDGPNAEKESPNLYAMRRQFDAIKGWTIGEVGKNKDPLSRLKTVGHFVAIAEQCEKHYDFHSMAAIVSGISAFGKDISPTISRLPDKLGQQYEAYSSLVKRPKKLREREKADDQIRAVIPWIDASLKQLAGMRDMLPDFLSGDLINFEKRRKIWDVFYTWQQFQNQTSSIESVAQVQSYLRGIQVVDVDSVKQMIAAWSAENSSSRISANELPSPPKMKGLVVDLISSSRAVSRAASSTDLDSQSSDISPRGGGVADGVNVEEIVRDVIRGNPDLFADMVSEIKESLQESLLMEVRDYAAAAHDEMVVLHGQFGMADTEQVREAAKRIVARKFPESSDEVREWSVADTGGTVYGWEEEIHLFVIENEDGCTLVDVVAHVDAPELGAVIRMVELHKQDTGKDATEIALITPSITQRASTVASERNIQVLMF